MPPAEYWDEEDEWYSSTDRVVGGTRHVRPNPPLPPRRPRMDDYERRSDRFLAPGTSGFTTGLHRTRSQGHSPAPNVTIYNTLDNDSSPHLRSDPHVRSEARSRGASPLPSPRGRSRLDDQWVAEELSELKLELQRGRRSRSQSRGGHRHRDSSPGYEQWQLQVANERLKEAEERLNQEKKDELLKKRLELKYLKTQRERDEEEARIKAEEDRFAKQLELNYMKDQKERSEEAARIKHDEELYERKLELKLLKNQKERDEEAARIKHDEELYERKMELKLLKTQKDREDEAARLKAEEERLKKDWELKQEREERKRERQAKEAEEERKRIIAENTLKLEKAEREAKESRQRAIDEYNMKKAKEEKEAKETRDRAIADYERKKSEDAQKAKEQREILIMQLKMEEDKKKEKEKKEWEEFVRKQKEKEEEEKAKKKKQEEELDEQMRKRLHQFGFQENQIQAMIKPEKVPQLQQGLTPVNPLQLAYQPTYVKVHKDHLSIDTLVYYDIPWEYDRVCHQLFPSLPPTQRPFATAIFWRPQLTLSEQNDQDYIIILREMDPKDTDILFEHTRRLRSRGTNRLLIEERHTRDKPEYAWVRKRERKPSASPSRRRSSPKRVVGIKEMFY